VFNNSQGGEVCWQRRSSCHVLFCSRQDCHMGTYLLK